jgi:hypothetical protein
VQGDVEEMHLPLGGVGDVEPGRAHLGDYRVDQIGGFQLRYRGKHFGDRHVIAEIRHASPPLRTFTD